MCDAARKLATNLADVPDPSQRSFGRFGGSITVSRAANMDGAGLKLRATWWRGKNDFKLGHTGIGRLDKTIPFQNIIWGIEVIN